MPEEHRSSLRCLNCNAALAHDQRYCVDCGTRRGPLPHRIALAIGALLEKRRPFQPPAPMAPARRPTLFGAGMPGGRPAALAVMGMLVFGFLVGGLASGRSLQNLGGAPLVVLHLGGANASSSAGGSGAGGGSGGGGGGGPQTVTVTQTQGASTSPAGTTGANTNTTTNANTNTTPNGFNGLPPIQHVFLIVFSGQGYSQTFSSASPHPYWNKALVNKGELLLNYYSVAAGSLANEIAMLSGQGPTPQTVADCPVYTKISPATTGAGGQVIGSGCVYPPHTKTLMNQLTAAHDTWKGYVDGLGTGRAGLAPPCGHPSPGGRAGPRTAKQPYAPWTNPFVFFESVTRATTCAKQDVGLTQLKVDLKSAATTPSFSYIVPSPCNDGSDTPCAPGARPGLAPAEHFVRAVLSEIESSPAYKSGGIIAITFDQAAQTGPNADSSSCCIFPTYPNLPNTTRTTGAGTPTGATSTNTSPTTTTTTSTGATSTITTSPTTTGGTTTSMTPATTTTTTPGSGAGVTSPTGGGGQVGLLLISKWVKPGTNDTLDYFNHFSLLGSIEYLFGLKRLGYAAAPALQTIPAADFSGKGP